MKLVVWKIPKWLPGKFGDGLNAHIPMKAIHDDNKTYYLNIQSDSDRLMSKWLPLIVEGQVLEVDTINKTNVNPYGRSLLIKSALGNRLTNPEGI